MRFRWRATGVALALALSAARTADAFIISGTLRDAATLPIAAADVKLYDNNGNPIGLPPVLTNAAGFYSIAGVPTGKYLLGFQPPVALHRAAVQVSARVQSVDLTVNATAPNGFIISGHVRDEAAAALAGMDLNVTDANGDPVYTPGDNTDLTGFYNIVLAPGTYDIKYRDVNPALPNYLDHIVTLSVAADQVLDVVLKEGITISGTVRNAASAPLSNITVDFLDPVTSVKLTTLGNKTDSNGHYAVSIPKGPCEVHVKPASGVLYVAQQSLVTLTADTILDFTLQPGVALSGTVTRSNLAVVPDVDIDVINPVTRAKLFTPGDLTSSAGTYSVVVPAGTWNVRFEPPVATLLAAKLERNVVVAGATVVSAQLQDGVLVSGHLRLANGTPAPNVDIDAVNSSTLEDVPLVGDFTDAAGNFTTVMVPGTYNVQVKPSVPSGLIPQELPNTVIAGTTTLPQVTLLAGITVTGAVTDYVGVLMSRVTIRVQYMSNNATLFTPNGITSTAGTYGIVIPAGNYRFTFTADPSVVYSTPMVKENVFIGLYQHVLNCRMFALVTSDTGGPQGAAVRAAFTLQQNSPNPFNPTTRIAFDLAAPAAVRLDVFDVRGHRVRTLLAGETAAGRHQLAWDGRDARGRALASGAYYYRLSTPDGAQTRRMTLVR